MAGRVSPLGGVNLRILCRTRQPKSRCRFAIQPVHSRQFTLLDHFGSNCHAACVAHASACPFALRPAGARDNTCPNGNPYLEGTATRDEVGRRAKRERAGGSMSDTSGMTI